MAQVHLRGVKKSYDKLEVIHGIDMEIADGEFIVIVGPSGCGKSTLLRMVAGLERITGGEIAIGDRVVNELEPKDRDIAMVFQNYALYPHFSVYENMAYGLKIRGLSKAEIDQRVQMLISKGDLAKEEGQKLREKLLSPMFTAPDVHIGTDIEQLLSKHGVPTRAELERLHAQIDALSNQLESLTRPSNGESQPQ